MEFTIEKRSFLRGLARTHSVADRKSSMPILSNVLLTTEGDGTVRLSATDLYLSVTMLAPATVTKTGSTAVSARNLFDIVKSLPEGEVKVSVSDNNATRIRCGSADFKILGMPAADFPALPSAEDAEFLNLEVTTVSELIQYTQYSMSSDDTRPHLAGALFQGEGDIIRMVTTDGHRLCKAEKRLGDDATCNFRMLIPNKGIGELKRVVEDAAKAGEEGPATIDVATVGSNAFFRREGLQLSVRLADEDFPPYSKVIPSSQQRRIVAGRAVLASALKRIALVASDKSGGVRFEIEPGSLQIRSENPDVGEGSETVPVDFAGDALTIGFNAKYVLDVLSSLSSDEVALELNGELDPGVIRPVSDSVDFVGVIMPMRI